MASRPPAQPARTSRAVRALLTGSLVAALAGCGTSTLPSSTGTASGPNLAAPPPGYVPDFASKPYEPFGRINAVAIAQREWRLFGQPIDDDPPDTRPPPPPELKPEREPGLWQRVGEYWSIGMPPEAEARAWTGKHASFGYEFPAETDGQYAWSAAFISYVMRIAGAGDRFPYSPSHSSYINAGARMALRTAQNWDVVARRVDGYAPQLGDIICTGRDDNRVVRFESLPRGGFQSHCQIVVAASPGVLDTIGGNVDDAVTLIHVPVSTNGLLMEGGRLLDSRYSWFVVLQVLYDAP